MVTKPMMDLIPEQRMETSLNPQMVFQDETLQQFSATPQRSDRKVTNFITEKMFSVEGDRFFAPELGRNVYRNWNGEGGSTEDGSEGEEEDEEDEEEEEDEEDDEVDEGDGEVEGLVVGEDGGNNNNKNSNSSGSVQSNTEKLRNEKANLQKCNSSVGLSRGVLAKDGNGVYSANNVRGSSSEQHHQQARVAHYENAVTIAEPDMYYSQFLQGQDTSALGQKEIGGENGCGFSGGKDVSMSTESGESLRAILSDPITGALMDDAMILPCGHSFGSGGMQHVIRTKSCCTCSQSVSEDLVAPNLSLRYAIQAFRREEELSYRASKRRRERFEQDKSSSGDLSVYLSRGKGVQFPFAVTDRVIIKGNKRTPLRFVGREAVVTTQCLNGWYVVKTLDNAESVKLQYRSLAKVSDSPSNLISKSTPNWL